MVKLGGMLIFAAFVGMAFWLVPLFLPEPVRQPILDVLAPILCAPGEKLTMEVVVTHDVDGTGYNGDYDCMRRNETTYDVSTKAFLIGAASFAVPFTIGLALFIRGVNRDVRAVTIGAMQSAIGELQSAAAQTVASAGAVNPSQVYRFDTNSSVPASLDLTARLKQLREAYDAGMITSSEYERAKADLLKGFSSTD